MSTNEMIQTLVNLKNGRSDDLLLNITLSQVIAQLQQMQDLQSHMNTLFNENKKLKDILRNMAIKQDGKL